MLWVYSDCLLKALSFQLRCLSAHQNPSAASFDCQGGIHSRKHRCPETFQCLGYSLRPSVFCLEILHRACVNWGCHDYIQVTQLFSPKLSSSSLAKQLALRDKCTVCRHKTACQMSPLWHIYFLGSSSCYSPWKVFAQYQLPILKEF